MKSVPAVSYSLLKYINDCPAKYIDAVRRGMEPTRPMRLGSTADALIFGGILPALYPGRRQGKKWDEFEEEHAGEEIVTQKEWDEARTIADAVLYDETATLLLKGQRQSEIHWNYLGRDCVSHPDVIGIDFVTDLKSTRTAHPDWFPRIATRMLYHAQLGFYDEAIRYLHERAMADPSALFAMSQIPKDHYIVAVENKPPHVVTNFRLTNRAIEAGKKLCRLWMERLLSCEEVDEWPAYMQSIATIDVEDDLELTMDGEVLEMV